MRPWIARIRAEQARGVADGSLVAEDTGAACLLPLGDVDGGGAATGAVLRTLHRLRLPPFAVACVAHIVPSTRAGKAAERYAYWEGARVTLDRKTWSSLLDPPVVLMYHAFGAGVETPSRFVVTGARFRAQMRFLALLRRPVVPLRALVENRAAGTLPPARAVAITIDDGYLDNLAVAAPILAKREFPATVFVVSNAIGQTNEWDGEAAELRSRQLLGEDDLRELQRSGVEIGAHTRRHRALPSVPPEQLDDEISGSRADLQALLGASVSTFAFPHGMIDAASSAAVVRAGFELACSIHRGRNAPVVDPMLIRRVEVVGTDSLWRFWLAVRFGRTDVVSDLFDRFKASFRPISARSSTR